MEKPKHYCGPTWFPRWARHFLSNKFNASCKIHDLDYNKSGFTRKEADDRFLVNLKTQAKSNTLYKALAYVYYAAVRVFGGMQYKGKD